MKTTKIIYIAFLFVNVLQAQLKNEFWNREFWKSNPTIDIIEEKIASGNDPSALNSHGFDAVTYAILEKTHNEAIKYLLAKDGNNVNKLTHDKRTYVFWAAYKGNIELVKYLIDNNANLNLKDSHNYSPLTFAAIAGQDNTELYTLFINNGIDIKTDTNEHGANALLLLLPHLKDFKVLNYFTDKGLTLTSEDADGNNIFNYTAMAGNKDMLELLIKKGIPYKSLNKKGENALFLATKGSRRGYNSVDYFKYLESLGLEPNIINNDGVTPLHNIAYRNKDLETFNYFLNKGVDANQTDKEGNTPLINASRRNTLEVITKLVKNTKEINHVNNNGHSALTKSINNSPEVISYLITKSADVHVIDSKGNNLAYHLIESFHEDDIDEFKEKSNILAKSGLDIKTIQKNGNTLFHLAVNTNKLKLVEYVNSLGINVNLKNKNGLTPLHIAAMKSKNIKMLNYLLSIGANKNVKTSFDETVFDLAKENEMLNQNITAINF